MRPYWLKVGPKSNDWGHCKKRRDTQGDTQGDTQRGDHVRMKTKIEIRQPQAKEHQGLLESPEARIAAWGSFPLRAF